MGTLFYIEEQEGGERGGVRVGMAGTGLVSGNVISKVPETW